jgi:hypothetical protein
MRAAFQQPPQFSLYAVAVLRKARPPDALPHRHRSTNNYEKFMISVCRSLQIKVAEAGLPPRPADRHADADQKEDGDGRLDHLTIVAG